MNNHQNPEKGFFYTPHTITTLIILLSLLYYFHSSNNAMIAVFLTLITIVVLMFDSSTFIRPHPIFWRIVMGVGVCYLLCLVYLLFQDVDNARNLLKLVDGNLDVKLPEKNYALDCSLTFDNVYNQLDEFVIAHTLGWVAKAFMIRNYYMLWVLSILFEVLEYSLQHQLPNFAECWWDHWILDVMLCNLLGLYVGMKLVRLMELRKYDWRGIHEIPGFSGKVKRALGQFTPHTFDSFTWTGSLNHYITSIIVVTMFLIGELNAFYMKYVLWIPPTNPLNTYRLIYFFLSGSAAINEAYLYGCKGTVSKLGAQCWICIANVLVESLICVKFFHTDAVTPVHVKIFWGILLGLLVPGYGLYKFIYKLKKE